MQQIIFCNDLIISIEDLNFDLRTVEFPLITF